MASNKLYLKLFWEVGHVLSAERSNWRVQSPTVEFRHMLLAEEHPGGVGPLILTTLDRSSPTLCVYKDSTAWVKGELYLNPKTSVPAYLETPAYHLIYKSHLCRVSAKTNISKAIRSTKFHVT